MSKAFSSSPKLIEKVSGLIQVMASGQDELGNVVPLPSLHPAFWGAFLAGGGAFLELSFLFKLHSLIQSFSHFF